MSDRFHEIVSGRRRGPVAGMARAGLAALSVPFGAAVALRNRAYDRGWCRTQAAPGPVVCVGNLTTGGTGKTPLVEAIAARWLACGRRVAVLGRGYGAAPGELNDELRLLRDNLPEAEVVADPDRVAGARRAFERGAEVLVLDDGFQHRRLKRDLDVVTLDAENPFGHGHHLPRGLLRERPRALIRAGAVVLTRTDRVTASELGRLEREVQEHAPGAVIARSRHRPVALVGPSGESRPLDELRGRRVLVFSGLARNELFVESVRSMGAEIAGERSWGDHHAYRRAELDELEEQARSTGAELLLTTQKDAVKLTDLGGPSFHWLRIELEITAGASALWERVDAVLPPLAPVSGAPDRPGVPER